MYSAWETVGTWFGLSSAKQEAERLRRQKRLVTKMINELKREEAAADKNRKALKSQMQENVRAGHDAAISIQMRDLARSMRHSARIGKMKTSLEELNTKLLTSQSNAVILKSMRKTSQIMARMNKTGNPAELQKTWMEFERESDRMEMGQDMMADAMDDATEDVEVDEDEVVADIVKQMREDHLIKTKHAAPTAPEGLQGNAIGESKVAQAVGGGDPGDDDLQARFNSLKK